MDNRDQLIVAQVSYKAAIDAGLRDPDEIHIFAQDMFEGIFKLAGGGLAAMPTTDNLVQRVKAAFPEAEIVTADDVADAVSDEPPYPPDSKIPAQVKANKAWGVQRLLADIDGKVFFKNWWDNRESAAGTRRPVLKHKDSGIALWADDVPAGLDIPVSKFAK